MAKTIMIQGTASNAGKSIICAALCRIFTEDGYKVAPFKSQNMALNSFITEDGLEMGRAQVVQAESCKIKPDVRMNPILLKPTSDKGSQVIVNGEVYKNMTARDYYKEKNNFIPAIKSAFESLSLENDIIVIEGAGSPAEINLKDNDIVNMGMAKIADSPVIIVGDIDRGGVFASLAGTMLLLDDSEKALVKGTIINKFRGDIKILEPGLKKLEEIINVPVIGTVPYLNIDIEDEDSLSEKLTKTTNKGLVDIAVIRIPRMSNFTDFDALQCIHGVSLRYVSDVKHLGEPDLIILPGSKNTMSDFLYLRQRGLENAIKKQASSGKPIFGICGGYQMLGNVISDPLCTENGGTIRGMELLDMTTEFTNSKNRSLKSGKINSISGIFKDLSDLQYEGYEIHMGRSIDLSNKIIEDVVLNKGNVYGTYMHGIFDKQEISKVIINSLLKNKGISEKYIECFNIKDYKEKQYDILASKVREALDMDYIYKILR